MQKYNFKGIIKASAIGKGGAYVEFPYSVEKEFGVKGRVNIIANIEGEKYRGSLVRMGTDCHIVGITKAIREKLKKNIGDIVEVIVYKDEQIRVIVPHPALQEFLKNNLTALAKYEKLSYTDRKELNNYLFEAKKPDTFAKRLLKVINNLK